MLYTINVNVAKKLGVRHIMITHATGHIWAPSKEIVYAYKYKGMSEAEYAGLYLEEMRESYRRDRTVWCTIIDSLDEEDMVISCFCHVSNINGVPVGFCHRLILAQSILVHLGAEYGGEITTAAEAKAAGLV